MTIENSGDGKNCLGCHFLCHWRVISPQLDSLLQKHPLTNKHRDELTRGVVPSDLNGQNIECAVEVWTRELNPQIGDVVKEARGTTCFYLGYCKGMLYPAAVTIERREADRREAEKDRFLTRQTAVAARRTAIAAIIVAAISAAISLGTSLWSKLSPQDVQVHIRSLPSVSPAAATSTASQPTPP